jgi:hypothetical protein
MDTIHLAAFALSRECDIDYIVALKFTSDNKVAIGLLLKEMLSKLPTFSLHDCAVMHYRKMHSLPGNVRKVRK